MAHPVTSKRAQTVATSTRSTGTVNKRAIAHLAAHYGGGKILATPLIVSGAGSPHLGKEPFTGEHQALAMAALIHAAGDRKDVFLRAGDCPAGGDHLLITAARRLGWQPPQIFTADWDTWCPGCYPLGGDPGHRKQDEAGTGTYCPAAETIRNRKLAAAEPLAHRGVALFQAGLKNAVPLDCAVKMARAGITVTCWCDRCGPLSPLAGPCREHSLAEVTARWHAETFGVRPAA